MKIVISDTTALIILAKTNHINFPCSQTVRLKKNFNIPKYNLGTREIILNQSKIDEMILISYENKAK